MNGKKWGYFKTHRKKTPLRRIRTPKVGVKRLPGKKIPRKERNKEKFSKLSLSTAAKVKAVRQPGLQARERKQQEEEPDDEASSEHTNHTGQSYQSNRSSRTNQNGASTSKGNQGTISTDRTERSTTSTSNYNVPKERAPLVKRHSSNDIGRQSRVSNASKQSVGNSISGRSERFDTSPDNGSRRSESKFGRSPEFSRRVLVTPIMENSSKQSSRRGKKSSRQGNQSSREGNNVYDGDGYLPSIDHSNGQSPGGGSPNTSSRRQTVHDRLYDPDYKKNRHIPQEPEPVFNKDFKSRPPKELEHVKSKHLDKEYFEPRGDYILDYDDSQHQFVSRPPKSLGHVHSKHLDPELHRKKTPREPDDTLPNTFVARPPKKLGHVESRIMDQKYFEERPNMEDRQPKYEREFKAKLPKKLEHVQSRILDAKKPLPEKEDDKDIYQTNFKAKPPKTLGHVESRILNPQYFEPRPTYEFEEDEPLIDTTFKAKMPKGLEHVESRIYDDKYYQKKIPPISPELTEHYNTDFKARLPKNLQHVQSRAFDPRYNKQLQTPRFEGSVVELKTNKGGVVVINVKKDKQGRRVQNGYMDKLEKHRNMDKNYYGNWQKDVDEATREITGDKSYRREQEESERKKAEEEVQRAKKKVFRPARKEKREKIDKQFFDAWVMTPTHVFKENNDLFYRNRQNVSEMWHSLADTIKKTVVENENRVNVYDRSLNTMRYS